MADDPLTRFTNKFRPKQPQAAVPSPTLPPSLTRHEADGRAAYEAYEPFENEIRTTNVELRCHRSGLSYFMQYAHMGVILFDFRSGGRIFFTGGGYAVTIIGKRLRPVMIALRLNTCGTIQEFDPDAFIQAQPDDPAAPFIERIDVEVLRPAPKKADESR